MRPPSGSDASHSRRAKASIDILITHGVVITVDAERRILRDGALAIRGASIIDIGPSDELAALYEPAQTIDARGGLVHPGFVDGHVHLSQHLGRSTIPDTWPEDREHDQWLPYWLNINRDEAFQSALLGCLEMAHNGITTFCDIGARFEAEINAAAAKAVGLRGILSELCWDLPPHPEVGVGNTDDCLRRIERQLTALPRSETSLTWAGVGMAGMGQCSDRLLQEAKALAQKHGVILYFHQSFAEEDVAAYRSVSGGVTAAEHFGDLGILGPDLVLIHMVRMEAVELSLVQSTDTRIVHCPGASMRSGVGASRVGHFPEMLQMGITVALGSDSGNYSDSFDVSRQAYLAATIHTEATGIRPTITAAKALEMATIDGARALGLGHQIGSIEVGKRADIVIHDDAEPEAHPGLNPVLSLIYSMQSDGVATVLVEGQVIIRNRRSTVVDERRAFEAIDQAADRLHERMGVRGLRIPAGAP